MSNLKFRTFYDGRMFYRGISDKYWKSECIPGKQSLFQSIATPKDAPIMQNTGMKDDNENEIWEGDIVEDENGLVGIVVYDENVAAFVSEPLEEDIDDVFLGNSYNCFKVIGNIFEDARLMPEGPIAISIRGVTCLF